MTGAAIELFWLWLISNHVESLIMLWLDTWHFWQVNKGTNFLKLFPSQSCETILIAVTFIFWLHYVPSSIYVMMRSNRVSSLLINEAHSTGKPIIIAHTAWAHAQENYIMLTTTNLQLKKIKLMKKIVSKQPFSMDDKV